MDEEPEIYIFRTVVEGFVGTLSEPGMGELIFTLNQLELNLEK